MRHFFEYKCNKKGVALLEFAIVAPLFFGLVFNVTYAGLMLHDRHILSSIVYDKVRYLAANENQNISIMPDATGGAGLAISDAAKDMQDVFDKVNNQLFLYELEKNGDNVTDVQITITPHEGKKSTTEQTSSYVKVTINDADVAMRVKAKLKEDAVPEIAALLCPNELDIKKEMRIEVHINKTLTVLGKEATNGSTSGDSSSGSDDAFLVKGDSIIFGRDINIDYAKPDNFNTEYFDIHRNGNGEIVYFKPDDFENFLYEMLKNNAYYRNLFFDDVFGNDFGKYLTDVMNSGYLYNCDFDLYYTLYNADSSWNSFLKEFLQRYFEEDLKRTGATINVNKSKIIFIANDPASSIDIDKIDEYKSEIPLKEYIAVQYTISKDGKSETYNMLLNKDDLGIVKKIGNEFYGSNNNGLEFNLAGDSIPENSKWSENASATGQFVRDTAGDYTRCQDVLTKVGSSYYYDNNKVSTSGSILQSVSIDDEGNPYIVINGVGYKVDVSDDNNISTYGKDGKWQDIYVDQNGDAYRLLTETYYKLADLDDGIQDYNAIWNNNFYIDRNSSDTTFTGVYFNTGKSLDGSNKVYVKLDNDNIDNPIAAGSDTWTSFAQDVSGTNQGTYISKNNKYYAMDCNEQPILYNDDWKNCELSSDKGIYKDANQTENYYVKIGDYLYKLNSPTGVTTGSWYTVYYNTSENKALEATYGACIKTDKNINNQKVTSYYQLSDEQKYVADANSKWQGVYYDMNTNYDLHNDGLYIKIDNSYYKLNDVDKDNTKEALAKATFDVYSNNTGDKGIYYKSGEVYVKLDCSNATEVSKLNTNAYYIDVRANHEASSDLYYSYIIDDGISKEYMYLKVGNYDSDKKQNEYDYTLPAWQWDVVYNQQVK